MVVLLLRPAPSNERFGLGPFFRIEPLGLEYIGAALESRGHHVTVRDLRFSKPVEQLLRANPKTHGFLIRRHGLYTWGRDLADAKRQIEILEFLFEALGRKRG